MELSIRTKRLKSLIVSTKTRRIVTLSINTDCKNNINIFYSKYKKKIEPPILQIENPSRSVNSKQAQPILEYNKATWFDLHIKGHLNHLANLNRSETESGHRNECYAPRTRT